MWMASAFAFQSVIASARACATKRASPNAVTARILKTLLLFIASSIVFQMACETAQLQALPPKMQSKITYQCSEYSRRPDLGNRWSGWTFATLGQNHLGLRQMRNGGDQNSSPVSIRIRC